MTKIMMMMNFTILMIVSPGDLTESGRYRNDHPNSAKDDLFLVGDELEGIEVAQMMDEKDQGLYGAANKHYGSLGMYP